MPLRSTAALVRLLDLTPRVTEAGLTRIRFPATLAGSAPLRCRGAILPVQAAHSRTDAVAMGILVTATLVVGEAAMRQWARRLVRVRWKLIALPAAIAPSAERTGLLGPREAALAKGTLHHAGARARVVFPAALMAGIGIVFGAFANAVDDPSCFVLQSAGPAEPLAHARAAHPIHTKVGGALPRAHAWRAGRKLGTSIASRQHDRQEPHHANTASLHQSRRPAHQSSS